MMGGVYVGVVVVALVRFVQTRQRRLLPVMLLFVLLAVAATREPGSRWTAAWHLAAGLAGIAVVVTVAPRPVARHK
jgi:hypothetical protein